MDLLTILPQPTKASAPFWEACDRQELKLPSCEDCGHLFYYPRMHCPKCGGGMLIWKPVSGKGSIFTFTHVAVSFHGPTWESQLPYTVVLVDLDEGPRMLSRLIDDPGRAVRAGDRVSVTFPEIEGRRLPFFRRDTQN